MKNLPLLHWMEDIDPVLIERADNYRATRLKPYLRVAMIAAAVLLLLTVALTSLTVWRLDTYVRQEYAEEYDGTLLHALDIVLTQDENTVSTLLGEQNKRDLHVLFNALRGVSDDEKQTDSEQTEQEVYSEGLEYRSRGDGNCSVVGIGSCKDIHLIIPKYSPDGELVVDIGEGAFENCVTITKVTIPDSVTQIQEAAFRYCTKLTEITLPENLTYIGDFAFESCWKLTELHIPASVTHIGQGIVGKTLLLESITVAPENTTYHSIENCLIETSSGTLIAGCSTSVIPDGVTSIGAYAFYCCSGLRNLSVPEGVTSIGEYAFLGCNTLTEITFPQTLTSVGMFAFAECSILRSVVFPESMTQIAGMAFQKCEKLESVILPADVDSIGLNVFRECVSLTEIDIPDGWTTIPGRMFQSCWKLERVGIPDSVTKIGVSAFEQCGELRNVHIPDGVTSISDNTFYNCSLTEIHIPEGVTSIG
ncbi:MAG: leucine-rich repeat domain-containing protein, partial [Clostridia bacterium]|nr:leucine-rich repeat domain-containing protein [Clostridia bacterium]